MSYNKAIIEGFVGKDPEIKKFDNGQIANFAIATTERGFTAKDGTQVPERTEWHNIVCRSKHHVALAENHIRKGSRLLIEGKIRTRSYADINGNNKYITEIHADSIEFTGSRGDNATPTPEDNSRMQQAEQAVKDWKEDEDDLPF